jgi:hypothetical protein
VGLCVSLCISKFVPFIRNCRWSYKGFGACNAHGKELKFLLGKFEEKKPFRRPRRRYEDNIKPGFKYGITPITRINWDCKPSGYAENPDNWIFL